MRPLSALPLLLLAGLAALSLASLAPAPARAGGPSILELASQRIERYGGVMRVDIAGARVEGEVTIDLVVAPPPRSSLFFAAPLPVSAVADSTGAPLAATPLEWQGRPLVRVDLPAPVAGNARLELRIWFAGAPECGPQGVIAFRPCGFGEVSWLDLAAVLPASVFGDRATLDIGVDLPAGLVLAGAGLDAGVGPSLPGRELHRLVQAHPSSLHAIAAGPFERSGIPGAAGSVLGFSLADQAVRARVPAVLAEAASALAFLAERWGPPPVEVLSLVQVDAGAAWATSGMIWLPRGLWTGDGGGTIHPEDLWRLVLPHEVAHQWFPAEARPAPGSGWVAEALAEVAAIDFLAATDAAAGRAAAARLSEEYRRALSPLDDFPLLGSSPDKAPDRPTWFRVAYCKGAMVLRGLGHVAGPQAFHAGVAALYAAHAGHGQFSADDLLARVNAEAGTDWSWLFRQWTEHAGYPVLKVAVDATEAPAGTSRVRARVFTSASVPGAAFAMPITFRIRTGEGLIEQTELVSGPVSAFEWVVPGRFVSLLVDPEHHFAVRVLPALAGDMDLSGEVDGIDVVLVAGARGPTWPGPGYDEAADLDDSGTVDDSDLAVVLGGFGLAGPP